MDQDCYAHKQHKGGYKAWTCIYGYSVFSRSS